MREGETEEGANKRETDKEREGRREKEREKTKLPTPHRDAYGAASLFARSFRFGSLRGSRVIAKWIHPPYSSRRSSRRTKREFLSADTPLSCSSHPTRFCLSANSTDNVHVPTSTDHYEQAWTSRN